MSQIRLIVGGYEVELGENFSVPLTKTFENLENPTQIINTYSKTITIPHTQKNDRIFNFLYNPDRLTAKESTSLVGIFFNPYSKVPIMLLHLDSVLLTGYLKVLNVSSKGYECSLNGQLGKIFQELQKITFDESKYEDEDKTKYWIDGSQYFNSKIDRHLIWDAWNADADNTALKKTTDTGYNTYDIIGWTPNNSFNDDFDYKTFQTKDNTSKLFSDVLEEKAAARGYSYADITGVSGETTIGDGLTPRAIGEFRSYLQLPFIYWNQLWRIFQIQAETLTGYTFDMEEDWFSAANPYWNSLCYNLKNFELKNNTFDANSIKFGLTQAGTFALVNPKGTTPNQFEPYPEMEFDLTPTVVPVAMSSVCTAGSPWFDIQGGIIKLTGNIPLTISIGGLEDDETNLGSKQDLINIQIKILDKDENETGKRYFVTYVSPEADIKALQSTFPNRNQWIVMNPIKKTIGKTTLNVPFDFTLDPADFDGHIKFHIRISCNNQKDDIWLPMISSFNFKINDWQAELGYVTSPNTNPQTLNAFWNNEYNLFTEILNYCKMFRISIIADDVNKKLIFKQTSNYFKDYKIKDWTDKLDKSKDYKITPVTWDKKYILFNYKDKDTDVASQYKTDYGVNYGEHRIITRYNFNDETTNLFSDIRNTIVYTPNVNSWNDLYDDMKIVYKLPAEIYLDTNKDSKISNTFGSFFFVNRKPFDLTSNMRIVHISDDSLLQISTQTYFYSQYSDYIISLNYLEPSLFYDDKLALFDTPQDNYTYDNDYLDNKQGIYDLYWKNYIDERYNTQNKIVDCYLKLTPSDYANFQFNHFIVIENQLYIINKISDYDIGNTTGSTKVQLITVQNIEGYTS